jgi:glycosyltransferase involved in cell wall biosynthesis
MKLSVVIITFNEEKNIGRCLENIQTIADEIIVLDSFSTDKTEDFCKQYDAQFYQQKFLGYTDQKNKALSYATNDFVLSMDADETLSDDLKKSILAEKQSGFSADAFVMSRCTSFCGHFIKHGSWYPDKKLRLFNKTKGGWVGENVHEKVEMQNGTSIKKLDGDMLHYSYYSLEEVILQNNKYTTIQAEAMFKKGKKGSWIKLAINPLWAFISGYIFRLGFLDGTDGFFIASSVAYQTMTKYAKLRKLHKNSNA